MADTKKLLVVDVAALSAELARRWTQPPGGLSFQAMQTVFPAVTCTAQASFRTATLPRVHGMVSNGCYSPPFKKVLFWEQAASLVEGPRIWDAFRAQGGTVGMMFWQQSLGESLDMVVSPRPIHKHSGGMVQAVYTDPPELHAHLVDRIGRSFNLMHYWGPLASRKSSEWIVDSICTVLDTPSDAPDVLLTYLPHLDYDLQRHGPGHAKSDHALHVLQGLLDRLCAKAREQGYEVLIFGDYVITSVEQGAIFPNRALCRAGWLRTQQVRDMAYPDFFSSAAFAMVDHEVAHVYVREVSDVPRVREVLQQVPGIARMLDRAAQAEVGLDHLHSGDLVLEAADGCWFAYPWWTEQSEAPDFAGHVDIHNKPGFDPCELFFGWPPGSVSQNTDRIRGTHGRIGPGRETAWASTLSFDKEIHSIVDLAANVRNWLNADSC